MNMEVDLEARSTQKRREMLSLQFDILRIISRDAAWLAPCQLFCTNYTAH